MTNWKSKYLEMKLKYINAKQKGGALGDGGPGAPPMVGMPPGMTLMIDKLAQGIRDNPRNSIPEMKRLIDMKNVSAAVRNYIMAHHVDTYCIILVKLVSEQIINNHVLAIPEEFDDGNGNLDLNIIIPHIVGFGAIPTTFILDAILESLLYSNIFGTDTKINLAMHIANLIQNHGAMINQALITSDINIDNNEQTRGVIYAQLHYIHNIPIYPYFTHEPLANMPTTPILDNAGNLILNMVNQPTIGDYAGHPDQNQAYAEATIQYFMQKHRLQLNLRYSIAGPPALGPDPGYPHSWPVLRGRTIRLANNGNYTNYYNA